MHEPQTIWNGVAERKRLTRKLGDGAWIGRVIAGKHLDQG